MSTPPTVPLAPQGPSLSPVVAGCWRMADWAWTPQERLRWIEGCAALGVTSFDHADIYGGYTVEGLFGEALALAPGLRDRLQFVSKCGIALTVAARPGHRIKHYDTSGGHIVASAERSLRELRTDRLDLLLLHRPDPLLDVDEVAEAFERLRSAGKVLAFGVSNFPTAAFAALASRTTLVTNQVECHPMHQAPLLDGTFDQLQERRLRPMIWSPLAGGRLFTSNDPVAARVRQALADAGEALGVPAETAAYAWLLRLPCRPVPITGSRRLAAIEEAARAVGLRMDVQTWTAIQVAATGRDVP